MDGHVRLPPPRAEDGQPCSRPITMGWCPPTMAGGDRPPPPALIAKHPTDRPWGTQAFMSAGATQREGLSCKSNQLPSEDREIETAEGKAFHLMFALAISF